MRRHVCRHFLFVARYHALGTHLPAYTAGQSPDPIAVGRVGPLHSGKTSLPSRVTRPASRRKRQGFGALSLRSRRPLSSPSVLTDGGFLGFGFRTLGAGQGFMREVFF